MRVVEQAARLFARGFAHLVLGVALGRALVRADAHEVGADADLAQRIAEQQHAARAAEQPDVAGRIEQHAVRAGAGVVLGAAR